MKDGQEVSALIMTVVLIGSLAWAPTATASSHSPVPADQTFELSPEIDVWERAALPLRTDKSNAQWTVDNAFWSIEQDNLGPVPISKASPVGVYQAGDSLTIRFDRSDAFSTEPGLKDRNVQLVVARIENRDNQNIPRTFSEFLGLLKEGPANDLAYFNVRESQTDSNGKVSFTEPATNPGQYVFFLASTEKGQAGFQANDGDLSLEGSVTILGVAKATVQEDTSDVSAPDKLETGETATFKIGNTPGIDKDNQVKHAIVLYKESQFSSAQMRLVIEDEINSNFDMETDSTIKHSIAEVNGVARIDTPIKVLNLDDSDGRISRSAGIGFIMDFIAENTGVSTPESTAIPPESTLDASVTAVSGTSEYYEIEVETLDNWEPGQYRWVHVAIGESSSEITSNTGELTIAKAGDSTSPEDESGSNEQNHDNGNDNDNDDGDSVFESTRLEDVNPIQSETEIILDSDPGASGTTIEFNKGIIDTITFPGDSPPPSDITVQKLEASVHPDEFGDDSNVVDIAKTIRIKVPLVVRDRGATIQFTLSQEELGQFSPDVVRLAVLTDDGWKLLETTHVNPRSNSVTFTAVTDSFSDFSIVFVEDGAAQEPIDSESTEQTTTDSSSTSQKTERTSDKDNSPTSSASDSSGTVSSSTGNSVVSGPGDSTSEGQSGQSDGLTAFEQGGLNMITIIGGLLGVLIILSGFMLYRRH